MHQYIERSIEATAALLQNSKLREFVGEALIQPQLDQLNDLFVPNMSWRGEVRIPTQLQETEKVPIIAVKPNQTYFYRAAGGPTPGQLDQMRSELGSDARFVDSRLSGVLKRPKSLPISLPLGVQAAAVSNNFNVVGGDKTDDRLMMLGRPLLTLGIWPHTRRMAESALYHELIHIKHNLLNPICALDPEELLNSQLRQEGEAHDKQAELENALVRTGLLGNQEDVAYHITPQPDGTALSVATLVAAVFAEVNAGRADRYFPDPEIPKRLGKMVIV